nr:MAG TPA: SlyX [Caudoviricetes sp.]
MMNEEIEALKKKVEFLELLIDVKDETIDKQMKTIKILMNYLRR